MKDKRRYMVDTMYIKGGEMEIRKGEAHTIVDGNYTLVRDDTREVVTLLKTLANGDVMSVPVPSKRFARYER